MIIGRAESDGSPLKPFLLLDPEEEKGIDLDFIGEAVKRFDEDENIKPAFIAAVEGLSHELAELNINDEYKPYMMVCQRDSCLFNRKDALLINIRSSGSAKPHPSFSHCICHHGVFSLQCDSRPSVV